MFDFDFDYDFVFDCVVLIFSFVIGLITFIRTGSIKKSINNFLEVDKMKYKTFDSNKKEDYSQTFSEKVPDYILNQSTNTLERLPEDKDIQAYIQSFLDSALERALEKYMPVNVQEDDTIMDYSQKVEDLSMLADSMDLAEEYREKYHLPDTYTMSDIYSFVDKQAQDIKKVLVSKNKVEKEVNSDGKSEAEKA